MLLVRYSSVIKIKKCSTIGIKKRIKVTYPILNTKGRPLFYLFIKVWNIFPENLCLLKNCKNNFFFKVSRLRNLSHSYLIVSCRMPVVSGLFFTVFGVGVGWGSFTPNFPTSLLSSCWIS